jgi:mRNA interferase RelE/StbE
MTYELEFKKSALKEWKKLGATIQSQFKKKLAEILNNPHIESAKLSGGNDLYKIKKLATIKRQTTTPLSSSLLIYFR